MASRGTKPTLVRPGQPISADLINHLINAVWDEPLTLTKKGAPRLQLAPGQVWFHNPLGGDPVPRGGCVLLQGMKSGSSTVLTGQQPVAPIDAGTYGDDTYHKAYGVASEEIQPGSIGPVHVAAPAFPAIVEASITVYPGMLFAPQAGSWYVGYTTNPSEARWKAVTSRVSLEEGGVGVWLVPFDSRVLASTTYVGKFYDDLTGGSPSSFANDHVEAYYGSGSLTRRTSAVWKFDEPISIARDPITVRLPIGNFPDSHWVRIGSTDLPRSHTHLQVNSSPITYDRFAWWLRLFLMMEDFSYGTPPSVTGPWVVTPPYNGDVHYARLAETGGSYTQEFQSVAVTKADKGAVASYTYYDPDRAGTDLVYGVLCGVGVTQYQPPAHPAGSWGYYTPVDSVLAGSCWAGCDSGEPELEVLPFIRS